MQRKHLLPSWNYQATLQRTNKWERIKESVKFNERVYTKNDNFLQIIIDEATGNNLHKVLCILVSRYSVTSKNIIVKHLVSVSLIKVVSETVFNATEMYLYCK